MTWTELSLDTTNEAVDWIRTLLAQHGFSDHFSLQAYAVPSSRELSTLSSEDAIAHEPDDETRWHYTLFLYLSSASMMQGESQAIADLLFPLYRTGQASQLRTQQIEALPSHVQTPMALNYRCGERFVIQATQESQAIAPNDIAIKLTPTLSFGSGLHPATILCVRLLERYVKPGMNTLDLGSGSGILSVVMVKLGASVLAADNDLAAVQATQSAIQENEVVHCVEVLHGSLGQGNQLGHWMGGEAIAPQSVLDVRSSFDLIVANILARVHITLAPDFSHALERSQSHPGLLITAGYTENYEVDVANAFGNAGFRLIDTERSGEWVAHVHQLDSSS